MRLYKENGMPDIIFNFQSIVYGDVRRIYTRSTFDDTLDKAALVQCHNWQAANAPSKEQRHLAFLKPLWLHCHGVGWLLIHARGELAAWDASRWLRLTATPQSRPGWRMSLGLDKAHESEP
jgi:hypothetical protein